MEHFLHRISLMKQLLSKPSLTASPSVVLSIDSVLASDHETIAYHQVNIMFTLILWVHDPKILRVLKIKKLSCIPKLTMRLQTLYYCNKCSRNG